MFFSTTKSLGFSHSMKYYVPHSLFHIPLWLLNPQLDHQSQSEQIVQAINCLTYVQVPAFSMWPGPSLCGQWQAQSPYDNVFMPDLRSVL